MCGKSVKRPGKSPQVVSNCSNLCDSVCSLKCIYSQYSAARPTSERYRATAHMSYSCPALASASNVQAAKAAMSVLERVENYSENLTLVTQRDRVWVRPSIQMQTTLFQRRGAVSNIASKCPGPETRAMQPAQKRSDRTNPGERAGERLLQPLLCGAQEGWKTPLDSRSQAHQQNALQASVQNDIAGTDPGANSPRGLVASVVLKDAYFHIQIAPHHRRFLRFALKGTAYQYPVLLFGLALAPAHFLEVHGRSSSHPLRASRMRILNYLDDWLILAQSRDTPASHIDKLLRHLEFLRLCVNMRKSILAPSQSNVSGSVLRLKAVEMRSRPPFCLPCAFSNWAVYYTCARCSFG